MRPCKIQCTYNCHWRLILEYHSKGLKVPRWDIFGLPLTHRVQILQKIKFGTSRITPHTSHITYYIGICKFYKILVINTVVTFNNSSKLILKTFDKYFLMEIITLTIQTPMSGLKLVKPTISLWNRALSEKFGFPLKSWKS